MMTVDARSYAQTGRVSQWKVNPPDMTKRQAREVLLNAAMHIARGCRHQTMGVYTGDEVRARMDAFRLVMHLRSLLK